MKRITYSIISILALVPLILYAQTRVKTGGAATPVVLGESWGGVDSAGIARPLIGMSGTNVSIDPAARGTVFGGTVSLTGLGGPVIVSTLSTNAPSAANSVWGVSNGFNFEGATADAFETTLTITDPTVDRTVTFPNASITVPGTIYTSCLTSGSCAAPATQSSDSKVIYGQAALSSASPSLATITGISPAFTATTTMFCTATPIGTTAAIAAGGLAVNLVSTSSFTVTGPNTVTTAFFWNCVGN